MYFQHLFQASVKYVQNNDESLRKYIYLYVRLKGCSRGPRGGLGIPQAQLLEAHEFPKISKKLCKIAHFLTYGFYILNKIFLYYNMSAPCCHCISF